MKTLGGDSGISNLEDSPFWQQFIELRKRFVRTFWVFALVTAPLLYFAPEWYSLWASSLQALPQAPQLITTEVAAPFTAPLKLACFSGFFITLPFFIYQLWAFIAKGLYQQERRFFGPVLWISIAFFYSGAALAYFIVCPLTLQFFSRVAPSGVTLMLDIRHYFDFMTNMMLGFGLAFELPLLLYICLYFRWVSPVQLRKLRRHIILGIFILAAILAPPDVISQVLLAIPLYLLFELSLWIGAKAYQRQSPAA